jgi:hypothetical protein
VIAGVEATFSQARIGAAGAGDASVICMSGQERLPGTILFPERLSHVVGTDLLASSPWNTDLKAVFGN